MNMNDQPKPQIDDRVFFVYGAGCGERTGKVIARRDSGWGTSWEVQMDQEPGEEPGHVEHIERYTGTAEDRGGYYVQRQHNGIGVYLVTEFWVAWHEGDEIDQAEAELQHAGPFKSRAAADAEAAEHQEWADYYNGVQVVELPAGLEGDTLKYRLMSAEG